MCHNPVFHQRVPLMADITPDTNIAADKLASSPTSGPKSDVSSVVHCSRKACRHKKRLMLLRTGQRRWTAGRNRKGHQSLHRVPEREKECAWRLSSCMPPRSPAGASNSIHHEVIHCSLCDLIRQRRTGPGKRHEVLVVAGPALCEAGRGSHLMSSQRGLLVRR